MSHSEYDYLEWRKRAEENGLLHKATQLYYIADSKQLYSISVDGKIQTVPIFTYREWIKSGNINLPLEDFDESGVYSDYNESVLQNLAESIAYNAGQDPESASVDDYMWNDPVYGITDGERRKLGFDVAASDYYTVRTHSTKLEEELFRSFYDLGVDPDIPMLDIQPRLSELSTPYRDKYAHTLDLMLDFKENTPRMAGGNAVVFFKTEDSYKFPIVRRSNTVAESRDWISFVPSGVFQPYLENEGDKIPDPDLQNHILKEYAEHFLDVDSKSPLPETPEIDRLKQLLSDESSDSELVHTATGIDCKNTNMQFFGAMVVNDESYYEEYKEKLDNSESWMADNYSFVDVSNTEKIKSLLSPSITNPYNVLGLSEGLQYLKKEHDAVVGCDINRLV